MIDHEPLQVRERLIVVPARHLELGEPEQRVFVSRRQWELDDDPAQIPLGIRRRCGDHRAPVQRVDVAR